MPRRKVRPIPVYRKQQNFADLRSWIRGFVGGRGTGKTWTGAYKVVRTAGRGEPWLCVSPDAGVVHETTFPMFIEVAKLCGVYIRHKLSPYPRVWFRTQDGGVANIVFRSAEKPEKLRGGNYAGLWMDEASVVVEDAYKLAIATLRYRGKMGPVILTFTPKGRTHWTFEKFYEPAKPNEVDDLIAAEAIGSDGDQQQIEYIQGRAYRTRPNAKLVHARTLDNPFLPEEFYANMRTQYSRMFSEQELEGLFVDVAGLLFRREWFLSVDSAPRDAIRVRYWDRAATPGGGSFSAGGLVAMDARGVIYIEDMIRGQWSWQDRNQVMIQKADSDRRRYGGEVITYTEQEGASGGKEVSQQIVKMLAGHPVYIDNVSGVRKRKVDGQELPGEAKVIRAMGLSGQAEAGNVRIVRGDWNSDFLDEMCVAKGTLITTLKGDIPVELVAPGDYALTRSGWKLVTWSQRTARNAPLTLLRTKSGVSLLATASHPVWAGTKGFTRIEHAQAGDELLRLCWEGSSTFTQTARLTQNAATLRDTFQAKTSSCIAGCLSKSTDRYAAASTFTTKTEIREITESKILNCLARQSITGFTTSSQEESLLAMSSGPARFANPSLWLSQREQKHAARLAAESCRRFAETMSFTSGSANGAERNIGPRNELADSARFGALVLDGPKKHDCQRSLAKCVGNCSSLPGAGYAAAVDPVAFVSATNLVSDVYNLEVSEQHEYFANGILTHNCAFPESTHSDQVDAVSGAFNRLASGIIPDGQDEPTRTRVRHEPNERFGAALALERAKTRTRG